MTVYLKKASRTRAQRVNQAKVGSARCLRYGCLERPAQRSPTMAVRGPSALGRAAVHHHLRAHPTRTRPPTGSWKGHGSSTWRRTAACGRREQHKMQRQEKKQAQKRRNQNQSQKPRQQAKQSVFSVPCAWSLLRCDLRLLYINPTVWMCWYLRTLRNVITAYLSWMENGRPSGQSCRQNSTQCASWSDTFLTWTRCQTYSRIVFDVHQCEKLLFVNPSFLCGILSHGHKDSIQAHLWTIPCFQSSGVQHACLF